MKQEPFRVSAFEVERIEKIKAYFDDGDKKTLERMAVPVIDVTVKNTGTVTTIITGAEFRVRVVEQVDWCRPEGGPLQVSGRYTAMLPYPFPKTPFSIKPSIRHEIRPNTADRFTFSVGPEVVPLGTPTLFLYQVDVLIHHDDPSTDPVLAGTALLSSPIYDGERYGQGQYRDFFQFVPASDESNRLFNYNDCVKKNREKANRFFQLPGDRSPALDAVEADMQN